MGLRRGVIMLTTDNHQQAVNSVDHNDSRYAWLLKRPHSALIEGWLSIPLVGGLA